MTPKLPVSSRLIFGTTATAALLGALFLAFMTIVTFLGTGGNILLTLGMFAGTLGAFELGRIMLRAADTAHRLTARDKRFLSVAAVGVAIGVITFNPAVSRVAAGKREPLLRAMMVDDLQRLVEAQEQYYATHNVYTGDLTALDSGLWSPSPDVEVFVEMADSLAWRARAGHSGTTRRCDVSAQRFGPVGEALVNGPSC